MVAKFLARLMKTPPCWKPHYKTQKANDFLLLQLFHQKKKKKKYYEKKVYFSCTIGMGYNLGLLISKVANTLLILGKQAQKAA